MRQSHYPGCETDFPVPAVPADTAHDLGERITDAVRDHRTPISQLLRLMAALEAQGGDGGLRAMLRARIGAPLSA